MIDQAHIDATYDANFYQENLDNRHQYDKLGDAIHSIVWGDALVVEVGCGSGLLLARLRALGHEVYGLDASNAALKVAEQLGVETGWIDLSEPQPEIVQGDVCICVEVAEHVPTDASEILVDNVLRATGDVLIWSAAPPGQGGVDHINEQLPMYWLEKFKERGWSPDVEKSRALRILMGEWKAQHCYARENFYVLRAI